ncbi:hypothetical protein EDB89DRAFT_1943119 [Lactarius sanguifluus]|nr:hypothetical protein EDB89DRAFT_1943119 [Lactarius sanguifluus]
MRSVYADNGRARWARVHYTLTRPVGTRACGPTSSCCTAVHYRLPTLGAPSRSPLRLCPFSVSLSRRHWHCQTILSAASAAPHMLFLYGNSTTCIMLFLTPRATIIIITTYDHTVTVEYTQHTGPRSKMDPMSRLEPEGSPELRIRVFIPLWCPPRCAHDTVP